ncbi:MAG: hypothetical protein HUJ65_05680 [Oscillospiraceae bacterium]|nr:hypothetical protein [Oscillospiraceae bacterium]
MTEKELKRSSRGELIDMIYEYEKKIHELTAENEKLNASLNDKSIRIENAGSIAEAALKLNNIFENAQAAADDYLKSVMSIDEANTEARNIVKKAEEDARAITASAEQTAAAIIDNANKEAGIILLKATKDAGALVEKAKDRYAEVRKRAEETYREKLIQAQADCENMLEQLSGLEFGKETPAEAAPEAES